MTTRKEVMREFGFPQFTEKAIDEAIYAMADEIATLREQLAAVRFLSAGWRRKANALEDTNAEWASAMSRELIEAEDLRDELAAVTRERDEMAAQLTNVAQRSADELARMLETCDQYRHRAERMEQVVEAAKAYVIAAPHEVAHYSDNAMDAYDDLRIAVRALDATTTLK